MPEWLLSSDLALMQWAEAAPALPLSAVVGKIAFLIGCSSIITFLVVLCRDKSDLVTWKGVAPFVAFVLAFAYAAAVVILPWTYPAFTVFIVVATAWLCASLPALRRSIVSYRSSQEWHNLRDQAHAQTKKAEALLAQKAAEAELLADNVERLKQVESNLRIELAKHERWDDADRRTLEQIEALTELRRELAKVKEIGRNATWT